MTLTMLEIVLAWVAGILISIGAIWAFASKVKKTFDSGVQDIVDEAIKKERVELSSIVAVEINKCKKETDAKFDKVTDQMARFIDQQQEINKRDLARLKHNNHAVLEIYKKQFRDIYYNFRQSGTITDANKAYLDSIFPYYKALGGNSDVEAKYNELCKVYLDFSKQQYEEARRRTLAEEKGD